MGQLIFEASHGRLECAMNGVAVLRPHRTGQQKRADAGTSPQDDRAMVP
jgi:hypothetical protein